MQVTIPHEVGHIILGAGHPDEKAATGFGGIAPLPGTDHRRRLMVSGKFKDKNPGDLLVKKEWDEAEKWLRDVVD